MRSLAKFFAFVLLLAFLAFLAFFRGSLHSFFSDPDRQAAEIDLANQYRLLLGENEYLRSELEETRIAVLGNIKPANVYSRYPFADRNILVIDQGSDQDIKEGMPVLAARGVLLGKVGKVSKNFSEVQTIFDPTWRSSVGIGDQEVKALLVGGAVPSLDLIESTAAVNDGDAVFNISPDFPYGLAIGQLADLRKPPAQPWFQGELAAFPDAAGAKQVLVDIGFLDSSR